MNFDHWKDVLNEETPALLPPRANPRRRSSTPDFYRAYLKSETDPRRRQRASSLKRGTGVAPVRTETQARDARTTAAAVLIPKAPGYRDVPSVTEPVDAFIPPSGGVFMRVQAREELA